MLISGDFVVRWLELLGGFSVLLQCLEYARITSSTEPNGVWAWSVQRADIPAQPAWLNHSLDWLYQPTLYQLQLLVRAMAAVALIKEKGDPTDQEIDRAMTNICRCGTYQRIRAAIHKAAKSTGAA